MKKNQTQRSYQYKNQNQVQFYSFHVKVTDKASTVLYFEKNKKKKKNECLECDANQWITIMYDYKISFSANAVCTHSTQVIIKSPTQIIKRYLKLKSSRMYSLQSTIVVDAFVDEFLKYLHCYSHHCCHRRHRRHHSALCTVDRFYLLVRLRLTHHLINCCPKCLDASAIALKRWNGRKRRRTNTNEMEWNVVGAYIFYCWFKQ